MECILVLTPVDAVSQEHGNGLLGRVRQLADDVLREMG